MNKFSKIILKSKKEQSLKRYHPWVFSGAIKKIIGNVSEGDIVEVYSNNDDFLGIGHYQIGSIAIRVFSFEKIEPDKEFWKNRILNAYQLRCKLGLANNKETNVYRLVNAEGDQLPGLIIDYYNGTLVMQMHSIGMYLLRNEIAEVLKEIFSDKLLAIYDKSEKTLPFKAKIEPVNEYLINNSSVNEVVEYGNKFIVDWEGGQKTGFFIDQRQNRRLLEKFAKDKDVLNVFGYTGGFSVYALRGGAKEVRTIDSSKSAIELTEKNINLNFGNISNHKSFAVDAFRYIENIKNKYDVIILDPPAFAKHHNVLHNALQGYKRINLKAIEQIRAGGIIFTFSCSQAVSKENFIRSVFVASANSGRNVKILHHLTQPSDHPVSIYHPEGEYLKGLVLYVE
ncbi:MAG: class I SAM-dependent rRNA methyltransferase [Bacteroidales bacterium]|nr:class I SAM-dependent rRNA methyltransferase [Bacteroidales bacterium]